MPTHQIHLETPHHQPPNPPKTTTNPRKLLLFLLKCIIMSCILSLFLLFLSFAALVLLHFLFLTTASRRRRTNSPTRMVNRVNLPEVMYENISNQLETRETRDCAICLEGFKEGESCRSLPSCGHLFHMVCVDSWLIKVPNCPVCRTRVRLGAQERSLIMSDDDWKIWWAVGN